MDCIRVSLIHRHRVFRSEIAYGGMLGNVLLVGGAMESVVTLSGVRDWIDLLFRFDRENMLLASYEEFQG